MKRWRSRGARPSSFAPHLCHVRHIHDEPHCSSSGESCRLCLPDPWLVYVHGMIHRDVVRPSLTKWHCGLKHDTLVSNMHGVLKIVLRLELLLSRRRVACCTADLIIAASDETINLCCLRMNFTVTGHRLPPEIWTSCRLAPWPWPWRPPCCCWRPAPPPRSASCSSSRRNARLRK